jgi:hypothetical protein
MKLFKHKLIIIFVSVFLVLGLGLFIYTRPISYTVNSVPEGASLGVDSPFSKIETPTKLSFTRWNTIHQLTLVKEGYKPVNKIVNFSTLSNKEITIVLEPILSTAPSGDDSFLNIITTSFAGEIINNPYFIPFLSKREPYLVYLNNGTGLVEYNDGKYSFPILQNEINNGTSFVYSPSTKTGLFESYIRQTSTQNNYLINFARWGTGAPPTTSVLPVENKSFGFSWNYNGKKLLYLYRADKDPIETILSIYNFETGIKETVGDFVFRGGLNTFFPSDNLTFVLARPYDGPPIDSSGSDYGSGTLLYQIKKSGSSWLKTTLSNDVYSDGISFSNTGKTAAFLETKDIFIYNTASGAVNKINIDPGLINNQNRAMALWSDSSLFFVYKNNDSSLTLKRINLIDKNNESKILTGSFAGNLSEAKMLNESSLLVGFTTGNNFLIQNLKN